MNFVDLVRGIARSMELLDDDGRLVLDSLTTIDFVMQIEQEAHLEIPTPRITRESFATVETVAALLAEIAVPIEG